MKAIKQMSKRFTLLLVAFDKLFIVEKTMVVVVVMVVMVAVVVVVAGSLSMISLFQSK